MMPVWKRPGPVLASNAFTRKRLSHWIMERTLGSVPRPVLLDVRGNVRTSQRLTFRNEEQQ